MLKILRQPFPGYLESSPRTTLQYTFYASLCVFILLSLLKPFGLTKLSTEVLVLHSFYFGLVTFAAASFNSIALPRVFSSVFAEERWTVSKELIMMLWNILSVTVSNLFVVNILYRSGLGWSNILEIVTITFSVGLFPVGVSVLLKQQVLLKKYYLSAKQIDATLNLGNTHSVSHEAIPNPIITIKGENQGDVLSVPVNSILYIEAFQNYVKIHFEENSLKQMKVMRSALKIVEDTTKSFGQLYRCHRAYIINLYKVEHISGNAQGYKLHIKDSGNAIPVSRSNSHEIAAKVGAFRLS